LKRKREITWVVIFFAFTVCSLISREIENLAPPPLKTEMDEEPPSLLIRTLKTDIETAGYYELLSWCERLGLSQKGDREELKNRLFNYYGISPVTEREPVSKAKRIITIKSARKTEYFTIEKIDEDYISLAGEVILEMRDTEKGNNHIIKADKIFFNQSESLLTASGNIEYILEERGRSDQFKGNSLTFDIEDWSGVFFQGVSETERQVEDKSITFYYSGETIHRTGNDIITLTDGKITSSLMENPYYHIRAKKIWVLAPGEWGLKDAVLYVGRIPLLYIPFFFRSGDELFFHPSVGYRDKEGYYIQTTTYLLGEKEKKRSALSFLQPVDEEETYKKEIRGLFLRRTDPLTPSERRRAEFIKRSGSFIKVIFDIYTRLGAFAGVKGKLAQMGTLDYFEFSTGVGRSRNIYFDSQTGLYTPFWPTEEGKYSSIWNTPLFLGLDFPIRYGIMGDFSLKDTFFTLSGDFNMFSDPYFLRDFNRREEEVDWGKLLGLEGEEDEGVQTGRIMESFSWLLRGTLTPDTEIVRPYLQEADITRFDLSMYWKSKEIPDSGVTGLDSEIDGYIPPTARTEFFFPERRFFYPESYMLPEFFGKLSGTIFQYTGKPSDKMEGGGEEKGNVISPGKGIESPWEMPEEYKEEEEEIKEDLFNMKAPELMEDLPIAPEKELTPFTHSLSYNILPRMSFDNRMNSDLWEKPEDVDFSKSYSLLSTKNTATLRYQANVFEKFLIFSLAPSIRTDYSKHFDKAESVEEEKWQSYLVQDYYSSLFAITNKLSLSSYPLQTLENLSTSRVSYNLDTKLYEKKLKYIDEDNFPHYGDYPFVWDKEFVTTHLLSLTLNYNIRDELQSFKIETILPPLDEEISSFLNIRTKPLVSELSGKIKKIDEEWKLQPFSITETLYFTSSTYLKETLKYDFQKSEWSTSRTTLRLGFFEDRLSLTELFIFGDEKYSPLFEYPVLSDTKLRLWWFTAGFSVRRTKPAVFIRDERWVEEEEEKFIPETFSTGLNGKIESDPLWKNRITVGADINASYSINFIRFTENRLDLKFGLNFAIYKFLNMKFTVHSENINTYRYFKAFSNKVNQEVINPLDDLKKSINFFDEQERRESFFKARSVSLSMIHHLHDWDLSLIYEAKPELRTDEMGYKYYQWARSFSINVRWNPIPEIKSRIRYEDEEINF